MFKALRHFLGAHRSLEALQAANCYQGKHDLRPYSVHHMESGAFVTVRECSNCQVLKAKHTRAETVDDKPQFDSTVLISRPGDPEFDTALGEQPRAGRPTPKF
ncbi:hypothetical protein ACHABX_02700 [Nesterenkonia halotolerans]|uniref:hypothetical protein n=1 Tax=Nesterenkonia halotolerans TaxID=225325 RepID=UPI003EE49A87